MLNKKTIIAISAVILTIGLNVSAQNPFDEIKFPIAELGNCTSRSDCKQYCDKPSNIKLCLDWAKRNNFVQGTQPEPENINQKINNEQQYPDANFKNKVIGIIESVGGPGGCDTFESCEVYCSTREHVDECFLFAKEHNLMSQNEIEHIDSNIRHRKEKVGPGGCKSMVECDTFCRKPENGVMCLEFAVNEGHITPEDAKRMTEIMKRHEFIEREHTKMTGEYERTRAPDSKRGPGEPNIDEEKAKAIVESQGGPGGCSTFEECDIFCSTPVNSQICMQFAIDHNLMSAHERERMQKMMNLVGPGGCRGRECETYCENQDHARECVEFAIENGFMSPEEAKEAQKFIEIAEKGGPGGCKGERECDAYCNNPSNRKTCFAFAKEHGLMHEQEIERIEKDMQMLDKMDAHGGPGGCMGHRECDLFCRKPENAKTCMAFSVEMGMMTQEEAEFMMNRMQRPNQPINEFEHLDQNRSNDNEYNNEPLEINSNEYFEERSGVNIFNNQDVHDETLNYNAGEHDGYEVDREHDEYRGYDGIPLDVSNLPGGCRSPEDCRAYCTDPTHFEECKSLMMQMQGGGSIEAHESNDYYYAPGEANEVNASPYEYFDNQNEIDSTMHGDSVRIDEASETHLNETPHTDEGILEKNTRILLPIMIANVARAMFGLVPIF